MVKSLLLTAVQSLELVEIVLVNVSLPVLNPKTGINRDFDSFQLMDKHNDMRSMLPTMKFEGDRPSFYMLNVGETHYPYAKPDEDSSMWPRISGVNGVFKALDAQIDAHGNLIAAKDAPQFFDQDKLEQLKARQVDTVRYLDGVFVELFDLVPKNTHVIVTSDHGELFGEAGYFGHGPIFHEKVFVVSFVGNVLVASLIVYLGDKLGVGGELSTAIVVVLGIRIFSNAAAIRRHLFRA